MPNHVDRASMAFAAGEALTVREQFLTHQVLAMPSSLAASTICTPGNPRGEPQAEPSAIRADPGSYYRYYPSPEQQGAQLALILATPLALPALAVLVTEAASGMAASRVVASVMERAEELTVLAAKLSTVMEIVDRIPGDAPRPGPDAPPVSFEASGLPVPTHGAFDRAGGRVALPSDSGLPSKSQSEGDPERERADVRHQTNKTTSAPPVEKVRDPSERP
jgi:hypothetical protein